MAEAQAPKQITAKKLADYLEVMSKAVFQSGISWQVVEKKWPGIREALWEFEPAKVAAISGKQMSALTQDARVIRNRRKLEGIVHNARTMLDVEGEYGSFRKYLRSQGGFDATVKDIRARFKFMGETGCYYFLYVVREPVPEYEEWCRSRGVAPMHG